MKKYYLKWLLAVVLGGLVFSVNGAPMFLFVHNKTSAESNAFLSGTPSPMPTAAHTDARIPWFLVKLACMGQTIDNRCQTDIKMGTNTSDPVYLGLVSVDVESGDISPKYLNANGYILTVNGPGELTLLEG